MPLFSTQWHRLLGLLGLLAVSGTLSAASDTSNYVVRTWDTAQGLPVDAVRAIAQSPDGYLWLGTFAGLARFDGSQFELFNIGNTPELSDNLINALYCDRRGQLWIGHDSGLVSVMADHVFRTLKLPALLQHIPIRQIGEDADGNIWLLNAGDKLIVVSASGPMFEYRKLAGQGWLLRLDAAAPDHQLRVITLEGRSFIVNTNTFTPDPDAPPVGSDGRRLILSREGGYWAVTDGRLSRWQAGRKVEDRGAVDWGAPIFATTCEWNETVAAGSFREGLNLVGPGPDRQLFDSQHGLRSNWISVLFADRNGTLWVGMGDAGLAALWPKRVQMAMPPGELLTKHIQSLAADQAGGGWVATEGAGLFHFDGKAWQQTPDFPGLKLQIYSYICTDRAGRLWADSLNSGLFCLDGTNWNTKATAQRVSGRGVLFVQANGDVWTTTQDGVERFHGDSDTPDLKIKVAPGVCCATDDGADGVWFGGFATGLWHWGPDHTEVLRAADGLPSENLLSLHRTSDGSLWIGTDGAGLLRYRHGQFSVITAQNGLPSGTVCSLIEDDQQRLWLGTQGGICAASLAELNECANGRQNRIQCLVLDTSDGLETSECSAGNQPSVCRTTTGQLWFATRRGVAIVSPAAIKINSRPPFVWIEQVKTDDQTFLPSDGGQALSLPLGQRRLQFLFNAPCLRAAHRVRFKHRLEPAEKDWADSGNHREVTYARVPPGHYTFQVIASNEDGVWNTTGASIALIIPPHLWERAWFVPVCWAGGVGTVAMGTLLAMRRRHQLRLERLERHRAVERERTRIAKDLHDDLGGSLTEINMLAATLDAPERNEPGAPEKTDLIRRKTDRIVRVLDEIVWAVNPRHDSVASLADYLSGSAREFLRAAGITLRLDVQRKLPAIPLSPECRHDLFVAVKETLNNIVRHARASEVWLRFKWADGWLQITVEDNGHGFDAVTASGGDGDGLDNLRERLAAQGGVCRIESRPGGGTRVELTAPTGESRGKPFPIHPIG
jgi:signal transduction histidine kinase/ligand-binding sensor domain-containing protein